MGINAAMIERGGDMTRREQAVEQLKTLGAVLGGRDDVEGLARAIMASVEPELLLGPGRQCLSKKRHATEERARKQAKRIENPYVAPYHCLYCHAWHNGNPPRTPE